eukprot:3918084-Prymnesium_polylepis.1
MGHMDVVEVRRVASVMARAPASSRHTPRAQLLVEHGADINAKAADGNSPLHLAAREGDPDAAEFLLDVGADPCQLNSQNQTPLDVATIWAEVRRRAAPGRTRPARSARAPCRASSLLVPTARLQEELELLHMLRMAVQKKTEQHRLQTREAIAAAKAQREAAAAGGAGAEVSTEVAAEAAA